MKDIGKKGSLVNNKTQSIQETKIAIHGDFSLDHTLGCGQCFRWDRTDDGSWLGIAHGVGIRARVEAQSLYLSGVSAIGNDIFWGNYFGLCDGFAEDVMVLESKDNYLRTAISHVRGMRLMRQDPWETLVSFIISQNNGIPRIRQIIDSLCSSFGDPCPVGEPAGQAFPPADTLVRLSETDLAVCRAGYRSRYLPAIAAQVLSGEIDLNLLGTYPYAKAHEVLLNGCGIGPKVADCILLFTGWFPEAFPVDRWVLRIMAELYGLNEKDTKGMRRFAADYFGPLAGLAQQYLFHCARTMGLEALKRG